MELLDLEDPRGAAHEENVVDGGVHLSCLRHSSHGSRTQLLERGPGDGGEVNALIQEADLEGDLGGGGEGLLHSLTCCPQPYECPWFAAYVLLVFPLELLDNLVAILM